MKVQSIALKGVTVFKQKQEVDFTQLPEGLIAIVGPNGGGKTSFLEALYAGLYREMPTHGSLYESCSGRDAGIHMTFDMDGKSYASMVMVDAVSEKQEAHLGRTDLKAPLVNGKVTDFDRAILKVIGSPRMMLSTVFNSQSRKGSFITLPVSDRKTLFIEMLGLGHCPAIEKKAKESAALEMAVAQQIKAAAERQRSIVSEADGLARKAGEYQEQSEFLRESAATYDADRIREQALLAEIDIALSQEESLRHRVKAYNAEFDRKKDLYERIVVQRTSLEATLATEKRELSDKVEIVTRRIAELDQRIAHNQAILARREEIEQSMGKRLELGQRARALAEEFDEAIQTDRHRQTVEREVLSLDHARSQVRSSIAVCEGDAAELAVIPCHGKPPYEQCPKIIRSIESRERLPELREQYRTMSIQYDSLYIVVRGRSLDLIRDELRTAETDYESSLKYLALQAELDMASTGVADLDAQINDLCLRRLGLLDRTGVLDGGSDLQLQELGDRINAVRVEMETAWADATAASGLFDLLSPKTVERVHLQREIARLETEARDRLERAARMESALASVNERIQEVKSAQLTLAGIKTEIEDAEVNVADWLLLAKAFSKDGIPALEIDAAGPGISTLANDLLSSCFSDRFSVDLKTQRLAADGERLLEDFDIRVIDSEQGRSGSIDQLSGGEKVIVNEAVGIAIAVYNKDTRRLETLFRDETTGALDVENGPRYVNMLRRAMKLGHFSRCLFITHNAECAALADARIRCEGGKITVEAA